MRRWAILLAAVAVAFSISPVRAQNTPPLEDCPGYIGSNPVVLELGWTVNCFLQAIHDKNKMLIATLAPGARCSPPEPCDGSLGESSSQFIFGPSEPYYDKSLYEMVTRAKNMVVTFNHSGDEIGVTFIPRPGKAKDTLSKGWMSSFFVCVFKLDRDQRAWIVTDGFCGSESDAFAGGGDEGGGDETDAVVHGHTIDLNGNDSKLPIMVWKAKKHSSASAN